jgi:gas vesicle protein
MSDASIRVMQLLDEMEEILETASKVPFSEKAIVDSDEIEAIIKDIRESLPQDIQQAQWVKSEQDRIIEEAKVEYQKLIAAAKKQADYLVETDVVKREAEKRAQALLDEADSHSKYMKLRSYEYIDKMLYDMQNEIAKVADEYIQPMNDYFTEMLNGINMKVNGNRQEMRSMAERIQNSAEDSAAGSYDESYNNASYNDDEGDHE